MRGAPLSNESDHAPTIASKEDALDALEGLGIRVFEPKATDASDVLTWDELAGYDEIKDEIKQTVVLALQNPDVYDQIARQTRCRFETNRPRAVLFEGPPGTGKTLSARIIAQQTGIPMVHIPLESIVSKFYGEGEKNMSTIFEACSKLDGAIIFIDEIDALAGNRDNKSMHEASRKILSVLLQRLEGFNASSKTTLLCATNRKHDIDAALLSRFGLTIQFDLPNQITRQAVFMRYAKHLTSATINELSTLTEGFSSRDIKEVCEQTERKWASKVIQKKTGGQALPSFTDYEHVARQRLDNTQKNDVRDSGVDI